jgi:hypothetical protein
VTSLLLTCKLISEEVAKVVYDTMASTLRLTDPRPSDAWGCPVSPASLGGVTKLKVEGECFPAGSQGHQTLLENAQHLVAHLNGARRIKELTFTCYIIDPETKPTDAVSLLQVLHRALGPQRRLVCDIRTSGNMSIDGFVF